MQSVQNVFGLLLRSRLMSEADARAMFQRWQQAAGDKSEDTEQFRRWVVEHLYLTEYQAAMLCRGHADGFFIKEYRILDRLGRGRMAGVYKASHTLGQVVAIKVLPPSKAKDSYLLSRFLREARMALRLKHPNVVRTFQLGEANGLHYIVMEYLEGETLEEILQHRILLPSGEAARVIYQALLGLQHLGAQGLVHRDLKPANLMLVSSGASLNDSTLQATVKILDIGLGRIYFDETTPAEDKPSTLTGDGVLLGTPDYLAPEQARNARGVDIRADIYSLGCVLYHTLAGLPPFPDNNIITQLIRHSSEAIRPLRDLDIDIPDGLQAVIDRMTAKDPAQRYATPEEAALALKPFMGAPEPAAVADLGPKMSQYLSWLEESGEMAAVPAVVAQGPAPPQAAAPAPAAPVSPAQPTPEPVAATLAKARIAPATIRTDKKGSQREKREKRRHDRSFDPPTPVSIPVLQGGIPPPPGVDVVLHPLSSGMPPAPAGDQAWITWRDLILLGVGAGGVLLAIVIGAILASGGPGPFFRRLGL